MKEQPQGQQQPRPETREGVILFSVAGFKLAIAAAAVKEIRGMEGLQPFTLSGISQKLEKLRYTLERGGNTYFVVDAASHFRLSSSRHSRVMVLREMAVALLVDATDRMMEISALHTLPRVFTHEEREWYRGLALLQGEVVPVVNHGAILTRAEQEALRNSLENLRGTAAV